MTQYMAFFSGLTPPSKKILIDSVHAENKNVAEKADRAIIKKACEATGVSK